MPTQTKYVLVWTSAMFTVNAWEHIINSCKESEWELRTFINLRLVCLLQVLSSSYQTNSEQLHQSCLLHLWRCVSDTQCGGDSPHAKGPSGDLVWKWGLAAPKNLRTSGLRQKTLSQIRLYRDWNSSRLAPVHSNQWPSFSPNQLLLSAFPGQKPISQTSTLK